MNVTMLRDAGIFCALALSSGVFAQAVDESALEALDEVAPAAPIYSEPAGAAELRAAMRRISFNPSDADAMADAGDASLALGDANAALNFFTRANTLRPGNSRIVSGLATATVRTENPFEALPLLQRNSATAWRARAFMLAARGDLRESTKVAQGFMDASSALRMERFFRLMPSLTDAQKAAAIHLGHFPTSQAVGRDSEQVRRIASALPQTPIASGDNRLIPSGTALGPKAAPARDSKITPKPDGKRDRKTQERQGTQAIVANVPEAQKLPKTDTGRPLVSAAVPRPTNTLTPAPFPAQAQNTAVDAAPQSKPAVITPQPTQSGGLIKEAPRILQATSVAVQAPEPVPAERVGSSRFDLGAIVEAIDIPESEQRPSQIPVDLKKLKPVVKIDPKLAAKAKAEKDHPARFWVQIATGNANALGFDYRKLSKTYAGLLKSRNAFTAEWGRTDRLLVGPFADQKAAKKWEGDYKKAGGDAFMWKSEIGEIVNPLKTK